MRGLQRIARGVTGAAVAAVVTATLTACGGSSSSASSAPKQLTIDLALANSSPDPQKDGTVIGRTLFRPVYDTLTQFKGDNLSTPDPSIATSWKSDADAKVWTFTLRSGVKFSDGTPMTSDDVAFSLNRFKNLNSAFSFLLAGITITNPDPNTIVLTSTTPNAAIPYVVAYPEMAILNSKVVKANGGTDEVGADKADKATQSFAKVSVGSGPYIMTTFSTTERIVYEANPNYWGAKPALSRIVVVNSTPQNELLDVQNGRADIALDLTSAQLSSLSSAAQSRLQITKGAGPVVWYVQLNLNQALSAATSNQHFRQALKDSIDYTALADLFGPGASRSCGIIPSMIAGALPQSECVKQDLNKAKSELAASGLANPSIDLDFLTSYAIDGIQTQTIAQFLKSQFEAIGVKVNLTGNPLSTELDKYNAGKVAALLWSVSIRYPDLSAYVSAFTSGANAKAAGVTPGKLPQVDALAAQVQAATSTDARQALTQQWQQEVNDAGPYLPLFQSARYLVGVKGVTGLNLSPVYLLDFGALGKQ